MMSEFRMIKSETFGTVQCDIYGNGEDFYMTREQVGQALEYGNPRISIANIHERHKDRLDKYSGVINLITPGGRQETTVYNRKGIMEICRWSQQPKADEFMDFVWTQ